MLYDNIMESAAFIKAAVSQTPEIGIILGSGLCPMLKATPAIWSLAP